MRWLLMTVKYLHMHVLTFIQLLTGKVRMYYNKPQAFSFIRLTRQNSVTIFLTKLFYLHLYGVLDKEQSCHCHKLQWAVIKKPLCLLRFSKLHKIHTHVPHWLLTSHPVSFDSIAEEKTCSTAREIIPRRSTDTSSCGMVPSGWSSGPSIVNVLPEPVYKKGQMEKGEYI